MSYTPPSLSEFNASAPSDDGSEVESNSLQWARDIVAKIGTPLKTFAEAINTAVKNQFDVTPDYSRIQAEIDVDVIPTDTKIKPRNLRRYATGDGVTDDSTAVAAWASLGGYLRAPAGTYLCNTLPIVNVSNTFIQGDGIGKTIFRTTTDEAGFFTSHVRTGGVIASPDNAQKENIHFRDLTVDLNSTTKDGTLPSNGIRMSWTNNHTCERVEVLDAGDSGFRVDGYAETFEDGAWLASESLPTDAITTTTGTTQTISHPRHSLASGSLITFAGVTGPIDGIPASDFNQELAITVVDVNTYTVETATSGSAGSITGGGSSITAANARHSTRWAQSNHYRYVDCIAKDCYISFEAEGGVTDIEHRGCKSVDPILHHYRAPSAFGIRYFGNYCSGGVQAFWADRCRDYIAIGNDGDALTGHGFALGRVDGGQIDSNTLDITDPGSKFFLTDSFQSAVGIHDVIISNNRDKSVLQGTARSTIALGTGATAASKRVNIHDNRLDMDICRSFNVDIKANNNFGSIANNSGLDLNCKLFGGDVDIGPQTNEADGKHSKYADRDPIPFFFSGVPGDSQEMFRYTVPHDYFFPVNMPSSVGSIGTNPTATTTLTIKNDGSTFATISITTGGVVSFVLAARASIAAGEVLTVVNQGSADATAADFEIFIR